MGNFTVIAALIIALVVIAETVNHPNDIAIIKGWFRRLKQWALSPSSTGPVFILAVMTSIYVNWLFW